MNQRLSLFYFLSFYPVLSFYSATWTNLFLFWKKKQLLVLQLYMKIKCLQPNNILDYFSQPQFILETLKSLTAAVKIPFF